MADTDFDIEPALIDLAARWPTYPTTTVHGYIVADRQGGIRLAQQTAAVRRCCRCHEEVERAPDGGLQVLGHLLRSHGYRMDGRQWSDRNELIGHA
jgi:hypothetical protein